ncbi:MAG TPA: helix-turn-helix domain-containing protein [Longimicrobiales bacterium]|nr:helix-turn-helix domain-containing protein [Longimicrobiales bacterium]
MSSSHSPAARPEITSDAPERELVDGAWRERWSLARLEREYILIVLNEMGGHRGRTAEILGIDRRTLYRKLREFGIRGARQARRDADAGEASMRVSRAGD